MSAARPKPECTAPDLNIRNWVKSGHLIYLADAAGFGGGLADGIALDPLGAVHPQIDVAVVIDPYGFAPLSGVGSLAF